MTDKICAVNDCNKLVGKVDWCRRHYRFKRLYGDPNYQGQTRFHKDEETRVSKICSKCKIDLPISSFPKGGPNRNNRIGSSCKECNRLASKLSMYKLTLEEFNKLTSKYNGGCYICGRIGNVMHIDHDHSCCPGKRTCGRCTRGYLCPSCNHAIGALQENPILFAKALDYLAHPQTGLT